MYKIVSSLALYQDTFSEFLNLRLINKKCNDVIQIAFFGINMKDNYLYARRTFIPQGYCHCCEKRASEMVGDLNDIQFLMDDCPRRILIVCNYWKCRLYALISKLIDIFQYNKFLYFYPPISGEEFNIPRTNPTTKTIGGIVKFWHNIVVLRNNTYYVYVTWNENEKIYRKLVKFSDFITLNPQKVTFYFRNIYKYLLDFDVSNLYQQGGLCPPTG